ncbi:MAG: hypothetical protein GY694_12125, partial [Gammaproteobacteria bacterium]|nr:hypothetical protein [Gammaproteobacteria bacterium]
MEVVVSPVYSDNVSIVIDRSALLWTTHWPTDGLVSDFVNNFKRRVGDYLLKGDVYVIFDRYFDYSTKNVTRKSRQEDMETKFHLQKNTKLPAQKNILSSINNKKQIIKIICDELIEERLFAFDVTGHRLIVTGKDPCPIEVYRNEMKYRHDLISHHEEADISLTQQALHCAANKNQIVVVSY